MTKRTLDSDSTTDSTARRVKPTVVDNRPFKITNLKDDEVVHQTCIVIHGECQDFDSSEESDYVSVSSSDMLKSHSAQHWPLNKG